MADFELSIQGTDGYGRIGELNVPHGPVQTPAMFPVVNIIGGTTLASGGVWRYMRDELMDQPHLQGMMYQAMSFTDYNLTPSNLEDWREKTFREWFEEGEEFPDLETPIFIDSGGFKLMNSSTFSEAPTEGGDPNEWGLYTNPDSILGLQVDFGADIIATLDYPIPPNLKEKERQQRMEDSIDSAVRCLEILETPEEFQQQANVPDRTVDRLNNLKENDKEPGIYIAIHGHDYETINWYVGHFLDRIEQEEVSRSFQGFAIGSLVPLRETTSMLVDIIQGAKDAIPEQRRDEIGLHLFGIGGKLAPLLALLGVDSYDCSSHMQAAMYKKYIMPETWENVKTEELAARATNGSFPCTSTRCPLCTGENNEAITSPAELSARLEEESTYEKQQQGHLKSPVYALLARHNFEVYNDEMRRIKQAIKNGELLDYVIEIARQHDEIKRGVEYAQIRNKQLRNDINTRGATDLLAGPDIASDQAKLSNWGAGVKDSGVQRISLEHTPNDFNVLRTDYEPPRDRQTLLLIPCSQKKPYSKSRTHQAVLRKLEPHKEQIHKVTISGMYGPVPEEYEGIDPVLEYEYVLASEDNDQMEIITDRLVRYLQQYGHHYDHVVGYVTSKTYRKVIMDAIDTTGRGCVFPTDPKALQLTEHFRNSNINELVAYLNEKLAESPDVNDE